MKLMADVRFQGLEGETVESLVIAPKSLTILH